MVYNGLEKYPEFLYRVEQKKALLSSVTHVPSGLMGCASAAFRLVGGRDAGNSNML